MKEVIFHFFPSVRFLGLSLKILFHKNKEIKRMLSKKMAFSLMSLITLLALAFVVPTTMAADDFDATFSVTNRVYGTDIIVTLTFGSNVGLANAKAILNTDLTKNLLSVRIVDKDGVVTDLTGVASPVIAPLLRYYSEGH